MFRLNIILMLSTIIPDLDCCSSFTIFNRKSIHLPPNAALKLSMHKQMQNHHNHQFLHQQQTPLSPPTPFPTPQLPTLPVHGEVQTNSWHKHLHMNSNKNSEQSHDDYLKINKSLRLYFQEQEEQLEQKLSNDNSNEHVISSTIKTTIDHQNQLEDDAQYKLISDIVSLECADFFKLEFCLNGGRCFLYPILNHSLSSCECAEGFVGERCEAKSYEFIPRIRPRLVLAKTKGGPLIYGLAIVDILFLFFLFCKNYNRD